MPISTRPCRHGAVTLFVCGDSINDCEGIRGHEEFRPELTLMYSLRLAPSSGTLLGLWMTPLRMARFTLHRAGTDDARWLLDLINREASSRHAALQPGRGGPAVPPAPSLTHLPLCPDHTDSIRDA